MTAVRVLGAWHMAGDMFVRISGQWRRITGIRARVAGAWQTVSGFTSTFSASAPTDTFGYGSVTDPVTITPTGGVSPYTYQWTRISGALAITTVSPNMATTAFQTTRTSGSFTTVFGWVATDATGATASGQVTATIVTGNGGQGL